MTAPAGKKPRRRKTPPRRSGRRALVSLLVFMALTVSAAIGFTLDRYTISLQSPLRVRLQWPLVISPRTPGEQAAEAKFDQQGHGLSAYQQYACRKFGAACRIALAIQRAENPKGDCEIYHYNTNGTLDWGYFQINTVHLERPGLNLRD